MSIRWIESGNILDDPARLLVVPVNCVPGVMGAGLARAFAARWPELIGVHRLACESGTLKPGGILAWPVEPHDVAARRMILFFATKDHWRRPSRLEWVRAGLAQMGRHLDMIPMQPGAMRAAVPALGAGLGGLAWAEVRPLVVALAESHEDVEWHLYPPR